MRKAALALVVFCLPLAAACGEGASFAQKPTAKKAGEKVTVTFAASAATDVAVYVLDAKGQVVRHLVAGVIGGKGAPPAPLKAGLSQSVEWDLRDDAGKPAEGGPFKVRVRLGMQPEFDRTLLDNPAASGGVVAAVAGPKGEVWLFHRDVTANGNMGGTKIKVLAPDGGYVRTVMPFPAKLSEQKTRAFGAFRDADGRPVPRLYNWERLSCYPEVIGSRGHSMPGSSQPAVGPDGRVYWLVKGPRLACLESDGGCPYETFLGPPLLDGVKGLTMAGGYTYGGERCCLAVSSDGKGLYAAGLSTAAGKTSSPLPCVFRIDLATRKDGVFVGKPDSSGKEKELLSAPQAVAAAGGLLYVSDEGADRIAVFKEADRSFVGEVKIACPGSIAVDAASGAIYVASAKDPKNVDIVKIDGYKTGKELYRLAMDLDQYAKAPRRRISLDATSKPARIWTPGVPYGRYRLGCFFDDGTKLEFKGDPRSKDPAGLGARDLTVDRLAGELFVKAGGQHYYRLSDKTGEVLGEITFGAAYNLRMGDKGTQLIASPDGSLVTYNWNVGLIRMDRSGKFANWPGSDKPQIHYGGVMTFQQNYMAVPRPDEIFVILPPNYRNPKDKVDGKWSSLNVIGPDGATRRTAIWQCSSGAIPRIDPAGNIYLAEMYKPPDRLVPEFFDGKVKAADGYGHDLGGDKFVADPEEMTGFWTSFTYGSIIKFPPAGGIVWFKKELPVSCQGQPPAELLAKPKIAGRAHVGYSAKHPVEVQGAEWMRFGFAPYSLWATGTSTCMCEGAGFDVDGFGRVFFPNLLQYRVEVVDTANNPITTFGRYGNADDNPPAQKTGGSQSAIPNPKSTIPLAWPTYVAVSDDYAYVNDTLSNRVVRVRLGCEAEEVCAIQ